MNLQKGIEHRHEMVDGLLDTLHLRRKSSRHPQAWEHCARIKPGASQLVGDIGV
jgi:hypothetical protein